MTKKAVSLNAYFDGIAFKRLSAVEVDWNKSNQHEFNGSKELVSIFGDSTDKIHFEARFLYFSDEISFPLASDGHLTWYDARQKARLERGVNRSEYRLYFKSNESMTQALPGDCLYLAKLKNLNKVVVIVARDQSTINNQLRLVFNCTDESLENKLIKVEIDRDLDNRFVVNSILEEIGVEPIDEDEDLLGQMLDKFHGKFPRTIDFSNFSRSTLTGADVQLDPDAALVAWMNQEEMLFRTLEKHFMKNDLLTLMQLPIDTDAFMKTAMSYLQRRKSRAGYALENHTACILSAHAIKFTLKGVTENHEEPDFILPSIQLYHDGEFPESRLSMLALKTTCKDRWRQILGEAQRVQNKHLLTIDVGISEQQTNEMSKKLVTLVIPRPLHGTYKLPQFKNIISVNDFIALAREKQKA